MYIYPSIMIPMYNAIKNWWFARITMGCYHKGIDQTMGDLGISF
jgi:hypothetical protein